MGTNRRPREEAESEKDEEIFEVVDVEDWEAAIRDVRPLSDRGEGDTRAELPEVGLAERLKERQERSAGSPEASLFNLDRRTTERLKRDPDRGATRSAWTHPAGSARRARELPLHGHRGGPALRARHHRKGDRTRGGWCVANPHPGVARRGRLPRMGARRRAGAAATRRRWRALRPVAPPARLLGGCAGFRRRGSALRRVR